MFIGASVITMGAATAPSIKLIATGDSYFAYATYFVTLLFPKKKIQNPKYQDGYVGDDTMLNNFINPESMSDVENGFRGYNTVDVIIDYSREISLNPTRENIITIKDIVLYVRN